MVGLPSEFVFFFFVGGGAPIQNLMKRTNVYLQVNPFNTGDREGDLDECSYYGGVWCYRGRV